MVEAEYLFITGCARSGTTAMANLLRSSPLIAMGRERFAYRYEERQFPPALFERERFCRELVTGDTHHPALGKYYEALYTRFESCRYRGDKIPEMACDYGPLLEQFHKPRIVFMLRNILDVANSFNGRAREAQSKGIRDGWPWSRDGSEAVREWNISINNTLLALGTIDIYIVTYETFFTSEEFLESLFGYLDLPISAKTRSKYHMMQDQFKRIDAQRCVALTSEEKLYIFQQADFEAYRRLLARARKYIKHQPDLRASVTLSNDNG